MKTIKTPEELFALRAADGGITVNDDLRIDCDVPLSVGRQIAYLVADGNLYAGGYLHAAGSLRAEKDLYAGRNLTTDGNLYVEGNLTTDGNLTTGGYLYAGGNLTTEKDLRAEGDLHAEGNLYAGRNLHVGGNLYVEGNLTAYGNLYVEGYLYADGNLTVRKNCAILGNFYWSQMSMPDIRGKFFHRLVLPHGWQRGYWEARLDMDFGGGCYDDIVAQVLPELPRLLRRKWSETERWMLESLKLKDAPVPELV